MVNVFRLRRVWKIIAIGWQVACVFLAEKRWFPIGIMTESSTARMGLDMVTTGQRVAYVGQTFLCLSGKAPGPHTTGALVNDELDLPAAEHALNGNRWLLDRCHVHMPNWFGGLPHWSGYRLASVSAGPSLRDRRMVSLFSTRLEKPT